jgi:hypothetical protein
MRRDLSERLDFQPPDGAQETGREANDPEESDEEFGPEIEHALARQQPAQEERHQAFGDEADRSHGRP